MGNTALFVIILALTLYRWFPIKDDHLLILMESKTDDVGKLNDIHGIISAFKVEHSLDTYWREDHAKSERKWNMIIITKNQYTSDHGVLLRYLDYIRRLRFVEDISVFPYSSREAYTRWFNIALYFKEILSNVFSSMSELHLTPLDEDEIEIEAYDSVCSDIKVKTSQNIPKFVINMIKTGDTDAFDAHNSRLKEIFLAIGSKISVSGYPEADYWDEVSIIEYPKTEKLCQMLISKEFQDGLTKSFNGVEDARVYITEQII